MAISEYKKYLNDTWNISGVVTTTTDCCNIITNNIDCIDRYLHFIRVFFSSSQPISGIFGEGNNIKILYDKVSKLSYTKNIPINITFSPLSFPTYNEYITGMNQFVNDIISAVTSNDTDMIELFTKQIETAKENDQKFINDIIIKTSKEVEITESLDILNQLVDFKDNIKTLLSIICSHENINKESIDCKLVYDAIKLLTNSINNYCYRVLNTFLDNYDLICKEVEKITTLRKPEFEDKPFALF